MLPAADAAGAHHAAERTRRAIAAITEPGIAITASVGSATLTPGETLRGVCSADRTLVRPLRAAQHAACPGPLQDAIANGTINLKFIP